MRRKNNKPSSFEKTVLRLLLNHKHPETIMGDFEEIFHDIARKKGFFRAKVWIWIQILLSVPSFVKNSLFWSLEMITHHIKIAARVFKKHKVFSFLNLFGLSVGMACCILIMLWVQDELSYDKFHKNAENIYKIIMRFDGKWSSETPWAIAPALKNEFPEVRAFTRYRTTTLQIANEKTQYYETAAMVDEDFFKMFTFPFLQGDTFSAFPTLASGVITERTAEKYFGRENAVGKTLTVNGQFPISVTGIIRNVPENSHLSFDILLPVQILGEERLNSWAVESNSFIQLDKQTSPGLFQDKISGIIMKYDKRTDEEKIAGIQPFSRIHLYSLNGGGPIIYVILFSVIAFFILLLACINFINLSTARGSTRAQEVGIRKVVGAKRFQIIKQFLGESSLFSIMAFLMAIVLVFLFLPLFRDVSQKNLTFPPENFLFFGVGLATVLFLTAMISGGYPALYLSRFHPVKVLKGSLSADASKHALRKILIVFHFTVTICLVISTLMVIKQLHFVRNKDLGFNRQQIVTLPVNDAINSRYPSFKAELLTLNSIVNVTAASNSPVYVSNYNPVYWEGRGPDQYKAMRFATVDEDYINTFEMEIIHGRNFSADLTSDRQNYIVNEEAVKFMGLEKPVGKMFSIWENEGEIIGVIKNFHLKPLQQEIEPLVLTQNREWAFRYVFIRVKSDYVQTALSEIEDTWKHFAPDYPFRYSFLDEKFESYYTSEQRTGRLLKYFSFIAMIISCLGIFGLSAFMAERKTKEIGVRKVLGASIINVVYIVSKEFFLLIGLANIVSWPISYIFVRRMLNHYAYRTDISLWIFFLAGILAYAMAVCAFSFYALRAARTDPAYALRYE
ncbi:MAG: ABC transporter permease [Candidatus Aminicenantes bacterium]|nr:ABC transporter permease [Candidatus Aminicenantes bacterium]